MNDQGLEAIRLVGEYNRRTRELRDDFYCLSKPANLLMHQQTARSCIDALKRAALFPLAERRIADIGCGAGTWLMEFIQWGALPENLRGIDLMPDRLEMARKRLPAADLHLGNAAELPWEDESCDIVTQFVVFTSIREVTLKRAIAKEMLRVLKPGGVVLWFDFRVDNPRNSAVEGIRKKEVLSLFPGCEVEVRPAVLAPPLCRSIAGRAWLLAEGLRTIPFLCTHYTGLILKPKAAARNRTTNAGPPVWKPRSGNSDRSALETARGISSRQGENDAR